MLGRAAVSRRFPIARTWRKLLATSSSKIGRTSRRRTGRCALWKKKCPGRRAMSDGSPALKSTPMHVAPKQGAQITLPPRPRRAGRSSLKSTVVSAAANNRKIGSDRTEIGSERRTCRGRGQADRNGRGLCCLRRNHHRSGHPVWADAIANGQFPRPGRWTLDARSIARQSRWCVYVNRHAAWRAGNDAVLNHHQPPALRHGDCRPRLRPRWTDDRNYRWAHPTAPRRSPAATARASRPSSRAPATRGARSPRPQTSYMAEALCASHLTGMIVACKGNPKLEYNGGKEPPGNGRFRASSAQGSWMPSRAPPLARSFIPRGGMGRGAGLCDFHIAALLEPDGLEARLALSLI